MKKLIYIGVTILIIISLLLIFSENLFGQGTEKPITSSIDQNSTELKEETIKIGYCPSMKSIAEKTSIENSNIILIEKSNSAHALQDLNKGEIDIILIGRLAKEHEKTDMTEKILRYGYVLVTDRKQAITINQLLLLTVHTALDKEMAEEILPNVNIVYHNSTTQAISNDFNEGVLINWDEFIDDYELLLVYNGNVKLEKLTLPTLYSTNYDLEKINIDYDLKIFKGDDK